MPQTTKGLYHMSSLSILSKDGAMMENHLKNKFSAKRKRVNSLMILFKNGKDSILMLGAHSFRRRSSLTKVSYSKSLGRNLIALNNRLV